MKRNCGNCGAEFETKPSIVAQGWGIFCSKRCKAIARPTLRPSMEKQDHITLSDALRVKNMKKSNADFIAALQKSHPERFGLPPRKRVLMIGGR